MTDEQQLSDPFWQMNRAALRINEIFNCNPALAENLPLRPLVLDTDEFADECRVAAATLIYARTIVADQIARRSWSTISYISA